MTSNHKHSDDSSGSVVLPKKNINKKSDDTDEDADESFGEEFEENRKYR